MRVASAKAASPSVSNQAKSFDAGEQAAVGDEGELAVGEDVHPLVVDLGAVEHDGVGAVAIDDVAHHVGLAMQARGGGDEQVAAAHRQAFAQAGDEFAEEGVHQVAVAHRQHHADEIGASRNQHPADAARHIAARFGRGGHPRAGRLADVGIAGERPRHGRDRHAEVAGKFSEAGLASLRPFRRSPPQEAGFPKRFGLNARPGAPVNPPVRRRVK